MDERGMLEWRDLGRGLVAAARKARPIFRTAFSLIWQKDGQRRSLASELARTARAHPDRAAIKHEGEPITYRELDGWSSRLAHALIAAGLGPGGAVCVLMANRPAALAVVAAIAKAGGVAAMINTNQRHQVLLHSLRCCEPALYVIGEELAFAFEEVRGELDDTDGRALLVADSPTPPPGFRDSYIDLERAAADRPTASPAAAAEVTLGDPCFYIFTSGTTGLPKASIMSHNRWVKAGQVFGGACLALRPGDTVYAPLPLYHNQALTVAWSAAVMQGAALAIRRKLSVRSFWDDCRRHDASSFVYIGELPRYLINEPPAAGDRDHPVRKMIGVGLRLDIWKPFKDRFGVDEVYEMYAASELNLAFANALNLDHTVGLCPLTWALVEYDAASARPVRGPDGRLVRVGKGEVGLLIAKVTARFPFDGYTDPDATEKKLFRDAFADGDLWVNSGDLMRHIGFRHLQFVDRVGDTFRWKSENVSTGEVEAIVNASADVAESTVYGVEIPGAVGRAGMATVVLTTRSDTDADADAGADPDAEIDRVLTDLLDHLRGQLPAYAIPLFVRVTDSLAVTGTFKHRKVELRDQGYDPAAIDDRLFVLLPGTSAYQRLTPEIHGAIHDQEYKF